MSSYTKISRASLYDSDDDNHQPDEDDYRPNIELDIVEIEPEEAEAATEGHRNDDEPDGDDEFEFPLFSFGGGEGSSESHAIKRDDAQVNTTQGIQTSTPAEANEQSRGRDPIKTMKVSLREDSLEKVKNERPLNYYFASYSDLDKKHFYMAAVSGDGILNQVEQSKPTRDWYSHKVMNLEDHNRKVEQEITHHKRKRPGKKQRVNQIYSKERKKERQKIQKELDKQKQRALKKKMFHKRGGKKHKKKEGEPVYRTE